MDINPASGYVLIEPKEQEKKLASGIYLPDNQDEKSQFAKVIAVGKATKDELQPCQAGDEIIYKKWGGNEVKISLTDKNPLLFVEFKDVLATIGGKHV